MIYENYKDYSAPERVQPIVAGLLGELAPKYLHGLQSVVLTNSVAVGKGKTMRVGGRRYPRRECRGFYHPKRSGEPPWIELVVDNILAWSDAYTTAEQDYTERALASVLFHEIGHHLDYTIGSPTRRGEIAADAWRDRLIEEILRKRWARLGARREVSPLV
ncbi:MAG TPA: hypothetical protein VGN17_29005 [Bryobacteraceae bacterium]